MKDLLYDCTDNMSIFLSFEDFCKNISNDKALIGIDLGEKTIGIAVSDKLLSIASPLKTLKRKKFKENSLELLELINLREIEGLILGLPINMDGSEGPRCQSTRAFAYNFSKLTDLSITFWDERLSTVAAERILLEADTSRRRRREVIDHVAAGYILQGALDRIKNFKARK